MCAMTAVTRARLLPAALVPPASAQAAGRLTLRDAGPVGALVRGDGQRYIATARAVRPAPVSRSALAAPAHDLASWDGSAEGPARRADWRIA
jgi:hypothetical protein